MARKRDIDSLDGGLTGDDVGRVKSASDVSLGEQSTLGGEDSSIGDLDDVGGDLDNLGQVTDLTERYEIQEELGRGGMGVVQKAFDRRLKRTVAIKRLKGDISTNCRALQRFLVEAQAVASLNHFHIVQIYDFGRDAEGPFLILEYVAGSSLADRLKGGPLPQELALELTTQLCEALAMAHRHGIIHRDIKPANVLLTADNQVKLTDFGLARQDNAESSLHTQTGVVLGTADFMPPEQRRGTVEVDARSDLWSVGATFYQMLTGRSPRVIRLDSVPESLRDIVGQSLEEDPSRRFQTAVEFHNALRDAAETTSARIRPARDLADGQCPDCGVPNELTAKFCRGCGSSLAVNCLRCEQPISIWTLHCTQCSANQHELLQQRRTELDSVREQAEALQRDYQYEQAIALARKTVIEADPRLADSLAWVDLFVADAEREHLQQMIRRDEVVAEATQFLRDYRYADAIRVLSRIQPAIRNEVVAQLLQQAEACETERQVLGKEIQRRLKLRDFDDLLPRVLQYLELKPGSAPMVSLRGRLEDREAKARSRRDAMLSRARKQWNQHNDDGVLKLLNQIPESLRNAGVEALRQKADFRIAAATDLKQQLQQSHSTKPLGQTLETINAYLKLRPGDPDVLALQEDLEATQQTRRTLTIAMSCVGTLSIFFVIGAIWMSYAKTTRITPANTAAQQPEFGTMKSENLSPAPYARGSERTNTDIAISKSETPASIGKKSDNATSQTSTIADQVAAVERPPLENEIQNSIGMKLKLIKAGEFLMGSPAGEVYHKADEGPQHRVKITKSFYMGVTEVTQGQWIAVMGTSPWRITKPVKHMKEGANYPAIYVSWENAEEFCRKLSEKEEVTYRLPTEAEWEYACCAGSTTAYSFGNDAGLLSDYGWWGGISGDGNAMTEQYAHIVGAKRANQHGLFDMHGNAWEWCQDVYDEKAYASHSGVTEDPVSNSGSKYRVLRGGGWDLPSGMARSTYRRGYQPEPRHGSTIGFRVVR